MATTSGTGATPRKQSTRAANAPDSADALVGDIGWANFCMVYLLVVLLLVAWLLFDTWVGRHSIARALNYNLTRMDTPMYRLLAYSVLGGAIGAIVNGLRSGLQHYQVFRRRHIWKYIAAPWLGGTLGLFVFTLLQSGMVVFGGSAGVSGVGTAQALATFSVGALAGYGSKDVYVWLDAQVHKLFEVAEVTPALIDQPVDAATSQVQSQGLEVGSVAGAATVSMDGVKGGTVIGQSPAPNEPIARGDEVNLIVANNPGEDTSGGR